MKKHFLFLAIIALSFEACNTPNGITKTQYQDDIYYSAKDAAAEKEQKRIAEEQAKAEAAKRAQEKADEDYYTAKKKAAESIDTTPFEYDDYYDYEYATRIRRFHNNCGSYGYYDNYYTNSYWYSGNPYNYGTSVYMGYSWWGPSYVTYTYYPSYSWYSSYGWGYDPWYNPYGYYNPYAYNPYGYYGYNPYNPYMNGYNQGYWNGYNQGYWNGYNQGYWNSYYFNSYDNNSYYYGPRKTTGSNSRTNAQPNLAHRYMDAVEAETGKPFEQTQGRDNNPYVLNTTVNDYMTKPVSTGKPSFSPSNTGNPVYKPNTGNATNADDYTRPNTNNTKPNTTETKPSWNNNNTNEKPNTNQTKPTYEQPKPVPAPTNEPTKPRQEPKYDVPKPIPAPSTSPRGSGSTPNPAPAPQPRKR